MNSIYIHLPLNETLTQAQISNLNKIVTFLIKKKKKKIVTRHILDFSFNSKKKKIYIYIYISFGVFLSFIHKK